MGRNPQMPSKVSEIDFAAPTYYNVAKLLALLVFSANEAKARKFQNHLSVAFIRYLMTISPGSEAAVLPAPLALFKSELDESLVTQGMRRLIQRLWIGIKIILPETQYLDQEDHLTSLTAGIQEVLEVLGHKNVSTAMTKVWKPSWPVFHIAGAYSFITLQMINELEEHELEK